MKLLCIFLSLFLLGCGRDDSSSDLIHFRYEGFHNQRGRSFVALLESYESKGVSDISTNGYVYQFRLLGRTYVLCDQNTRFVGSSWLTTTADTLEAMEAWPETGHSAYLKELKKYEVIVTSGGEALDNLSVILEEGIKRGVKER